MFGKVGVGSHLIQPHYLVPMIEPVLSANTSIHKIYCLPCFQIKNYFSSMAWQLNKKQMARVQKAIKEKCDGYNSTKNKRRKPIEDSVLLKKIEGYMH